MPTSGFGGSVVDATPERDGYVVIGGIALTRYQPRGPRIAMGLVLLAAAAAPIWWAIATRPTGVSPLDGVWGRLWDAWNEPARLFPLVIAAAWVWFAVAFAAIELIARTSRFVLARFGTTRMTVQLTGGPLRDGLAACFDLFRRQRDVPYIALDSAELERPGSPRVVVVADGGERLVFRAPPGEAEGVVQFLRTRIGQRPDPIAPFQFRYRNDALHAAVYLTLVLLLYRYTLYGINTPAIADFLHSWLPDWGVAVWCILGLIVPGIVVGTVGRRVFSRLGYAIIDCDGVEIHQGRRVRFVPWKRITRVAYVSGGRVAGLHIDAGFGGVMIPADPSDRGRAQEALANRLNKELAERRASGEARASRRRSGRRNG